MFCVKCGAAMQEGQQFCASCGTRVAEQQPIRTKKPTAQQK